MRRDFIRLLHSETKANAIVDAIDYQIPVTWLSVLGGLSKCEEDGDTHVTYILVHIGYKNRP